MMKLNHIGFLAEDCVQAAKFVDTMLGPQKWEFFDFYFPPETVRIGGEIRLKTAVANFGPCDFEILAPYDCPGAYLYDCLKERGPGLHHLAYFFDTLEEMYEQVDKLEAEGYVRLHDTERLPGHPTIYLQAPDQSMIYELHV